MKPLISIVIPCFNSQSFLQNTIDIVENEDIENCEIVLINDGSTDNTLDIIKLNSQRYENIKYISRENKGVSVSRNEGLLAANGQYIYFLDSDDEIEKGTISYFKEAIKNQSGCDIIAFGYKMRLLTGKEYYYVNKDLNGSVLKKQECADLFFRGLLFLNICSVLLNRDFLIRNSLVFKNGVTIGEDFDFLLRASLYSRKAYYDERICFVYILRRGSATDGHKAYGLDDYKSLLLNFKIAELAKDILDEQTINYFLAARYSSNLLSYLRAQYKSKKSNDFFVQKNGCLYKKIRKGRRKVMLAIYFFRVAPIKIIIKMLKRTA